MGFLKSLSAMFKPKPLGDEALARVAAAVVKIRSRALPCLHLTDGEGGASWLGGTAALPEHASWPANGNRALDFLAQIDLAQARRAEGPDWLPPTGRLLFFYDAQSEDSGDSPGDGENWRVIYDASPAPPEGAAQTTAVATYQRRSVRFTRGVSLPGFERCDDVVHGMSRREDRAVFDALDVTGGPHPNYQIGGYPQAIQDDSMELTCELASRGDDSQDVDKYADERLRAAAAADWRLLLQLDSDRVTGMTWWADGMLYFFIRERDARAGDFSRVWMVAQWS